MQIKHCNRPYFYSSEDEVEYFEPCQIQVCKAMEEIEPKH